MGKRDSSMYRHIKVLPSNGFMPNEIKCTGTEVPTYSDTLRTWEKCHCNQIVTVTRGSLVTNKSIGTCQKCHCKRGVTVNSVTVSGDICSQYSGWKITPLENQPGWNEARMTGRKICRRWIDRFKGRLQPLSHEKPPPRPARIGPHLRFQILGLQATDVTQKNLLASFLVLASQQTATE